MSATDRPDAPGLLLRLVIVAAVLVLVLFVRGIIGALFVP